MYPNGYNVYKSNSINYASKEQLLLMLTEGAVKFAKIGRKAIVDKDIEKAHNSLIRTQEIFTELMVTLDQSKGNWTENLFNLYDFIKRKLVEANIKKDINTIDEIISMIEEINDMWHEAYKLSRK